MATPEEIEALRQRNAAARAEAERRGKELDQQRTSRSTAKAKETRDAGSRASRDADARELKPKTAKEGSGRRTDKKSK